MKFPTSTRREHQQELFAVGGDIELTPAGGLNKTGGRQCGWSSRDQVGCGLNCDGEQPVAGVVIQLTAIRRPERMLSAVLRDLEFDGRWRNGLYVDFESAGLIGNVCQPAFIGRHAAAVLR